MNFKLFLTIASWTVCLNLCGAAPNRVIRQSLNDLPQQANFDQNRFVPRQFAVNQQQFGPQPLPQNQFIPNGQFFPNQFQPNSFPNQQFPGPVQQPQFLPNQQNSPVFAPNVPIPTPSPVPSNQPGQPLPPASTSQRVPPSLQGWIIF